MLILELTGTVASAKMNIAQNSKVTVSESPIHGKGLFAGDLAIDSGEFVLRMVAQQFAVEKFHPWNGEDMGTIPYFINHSCEPNSAVYFSPAEQAMILVASRRIEPGEEITLDYNLLEVGGNLIPCNCPSPKCRGMFPVHRKKLIV